MWANGDTRDNGSSSIEYKVQSSLQIDGFGIYTNEQKKYVSLEWQESKDPIVGHGPSKYPTTLSSWSYNDLLNKMIYAKWSKIWSDLSNFQ